MATIAKNKSAEKTGRMIIKDMNHLKGKVHFPEKLAKAKEFLAPFFEANKIAPITPPDSNS